MLSALIGVFPAVVRNCAEKSGQVRSGQMSHHSKLVPHAVRGAQQQGSVCLSSTSTQCACSCKSLSSPPRANTKDILELYELLLQQGEVEVRHYANSGDNTQREVNSSPMSVATLIRHIESGEARRRDLYLANYDLSDHTTPTCKSGGGVSSSGSTTSSEVFQQVCRRLCNMDRIETILGLHASLTDPIRIWLGPGGHREQLHYDIYDNIHVCLVGRKQWRLFPPTLRNFIVCAPFSLWEARHTGVGEVSVNFATRTADESVMCGAKGEVLITLEAGDAIWVPALWWHEVRGEEVTETKHDGWDSSGSFSSSISSSCSDRNSSSSCGCKISACDHDICPTLFVKSISSTGEVKPGHGSDEKDDIKQLERIIDCFVLSANQFQRVRRAASLLQWLQSPAAWWQSTRLWLYDLLCFHRPSGDSELELV